MTVDVWVYLWALYSIPLMHMSVFVSVQLCFYYSSFVILSEVWKGYTASFVLSQDSFGNSESSVVPYSFRIFLL